MKKFTLPAIGLVVSVLILFVYPAANSGEGTSRVGAETSAIIVALCHYKETFGDFPKGSTAEICKSLSGTNPKNIRFIELPKRSISSDGSFMDTWGTPYEIYFSSEGPLSRSAGKNKTFEEGNVKHSDDFYRS